jgi:hypothetical protein
MHNFKGQQSHVDAQSKQIKEHQGTINTLNEVRQDNGMA